jgi:hypothetical protein
MESEFVYSRVQTYQGSRLFEKFAENIGLSNDLVSLIIIFENILHIISISINMFLIIDNTYQQVRAMPNCI